GTALLFLAVAFYLVMLCENCRVPVDDPETHLELTMIHEAMILDNSGPDLAVIHYASALKLWVFISFLATLVMPNMAAGTLVEFIVYYILILVLTVSIGVVESVMARYRFLKVPQLLAGAFAVAVLSIVLTSIFGGEWTK
ncbi:MAG: hydrogenase, partial [Lentisphaerae bacterium]|nr:hydrogenase [Lentisphaerota bacterium]